MYNFNAIKNRTEVVRYKFACAYVNVVNPDELALAEQGDELLENMLKACEVEDITLVRIYWDEFSWVTKCLRDLAS